MIELLVGWIVAIIVGWIFGQCVIIRNHENYEKIIGAEISQDSRWIEAWRDAINGGESFKKHFRGYNRLLGCIEITIFYICSINSNLLIGIGAWLAFKLAAKWESWTNISRVPDSIHYEGKKIDDLHYLKERHRLACSVFQTFLIGTGGNIIAAFIGMAVYREVIPRVLEWASNSSDIILIFLN